MKPKEIEFNADELKESLGQLLDHARGKPGAKVTSKRRPDMALTKAYRETVIARIKRDPKFARALYAEAVNAILEGETAEGLSMLRDRVHAEITFKELARQTGFDEKSLHRMLGRHGNPTARTLATIFRAIREDLGIAPRVTVAAA